MTTKPKKKLCWNCEGSVTFEEENCPYCGVYLSPSSPSDFNDASGLMPPYRIDDDAEEEELPPPPYKQDEVSEAESIEEADGSGDLRAVVIPLSLLLSGSVFFLFGLVLLLFSNNGTFTLSWSTAFWYVYFAAGVVMLFFGWRALHALKD
ncbi:MAG: zinc ribbon domain-containing protein [Chlamydiia bacterium]|nr:zinc ribbon domain-containing protein [Chlamydiia bacterium]